MRRFACLLLLTLLVACGGDQPAQPDGNGGEGDAAPGPKPALRVAVDVGYQPFEMRTAKGELIGFDVELARAIGEQLGREVDFVSVKWEAIIPTLKTGGADVIISGMSITDERKKAVAFSDAYYEIGQAVLLAAKHKDAITSHEQLDQEGLVVVTQQGTTGEAAIRKHMPKATVKVYENQTLAALEVIQGRADAMVFDHPFIGIMAKRNPKTTVGLMKPFTAEEIGIALRPKDTELLRQINDALKALRDDGTHAKLVARYFEEMAWLEQVPAPK